MTLALKSGPYALMLAPEKGGAILRFDWHDKVILRPVCGPSILDVGCFPLVPFSNRIAHGRFKANGHAIVLAPNLPEVDQLHPLHGFGWLSEWQIVSCDDASATLEHAYYGGEWPWSYLSSQSVQLSEQGLALTLSVTNLSEQPMPAGLGFHPYFPRNEHTLFRGLHRGEWTSTEDCLPGMLNSKSGPHDWWDAQTVGSRTVDTVYTGRDGPLVINWPDRDLEVIVTPSHNLSFTVVYTPADANFFCVEPVSHMSNAVNHMDLEHGLVWLKAGETLKVGLEMAVR